MSSLLDGIVVVTIAQNVPGPLAAARLAESGARVTKVEPPDGDPMLTLSADWHAEMHVGVAIERLDLKSASGSRRLRELLHDADLLITSQRPAALARLSLGPDHLQSLGERLRMVRIVGSVRNPEQPGHDLTYQAEAGLIQDSMPRTLMADVMASERAFAASLAALRQPPGTCIDVGLVESLAPMLAPLRHRLTSPDGVLGGAAPRYRVYAAKLGHIAVAALEPHFERKLYQELDAPLSSELQERFTAKTADEWERWAEARDLPIVAIRST